MERFVFRTTAGELTDTFKVKPESEHLITPTFNAAPGHIHSVIRNNEKRVLESAKWKPETPSIHISNKAKTPIFSAKQVPCIIPINGFYMWKQTVNDPLPFFVRIHSRKLLAIAGVLSIAEKRKSFQVLTRESSVLLKPLNDEMPCILEPNEVETWLNGQQEQILAKGFSHNLIMPDMTVFRVPNLVNDISNNGPELIQPIPKLRDED